MKKLLCILLLVLCKTSSGTPGYKILKGHNLPVREIRSYTRKEMVDFFTVFNKIYRIDQSVRNKSHDYVIKNYRKADSITYHQYKDFFEKTGYFSFNKNVMSKWVPDVTGFLLKHYAMQMHYCDGYAFDLLRLIEKSIYRQSCNEEDLMDFFVTYLWQRTAFMVYRLSSVNFRIVLLPNIDSCAFKEYYKYAYSQFITYCKITNVHFSFIRLSNVLINEHKVFDWSHINPITSLESKKVDNNIINLIKHPSIKYILEFHIKGNNPYTIQAGSYDVLICTDPVLVCNPEYNF